MNFKALKLDISFSIYKEILQWNRLHLGILVVFALAFSWSQVSLAQAPTNSAKKNARGQGRERHMTREATVKTRDQKKLDFDSVDIGGARKAPMGNLINSNKSDKEYDFVKIRLRWHPEMIQSASSLDARSK